jgi:kinetochore protein Nuf2
MVKGIFPTITIPLAINALAGWNLVVSQEQLLRPSPDFVEGVYYACLQLATELTHDAIRDPVLALLASMDDTNPVR